MYDIFVAFCMGYTCMSLFIEFFKFLQRGND
jgi:hypothetical protein